MKPTYFTSAAKFRLWLERNHATATEFIVGFYKKDSGKGGLTYQEAVDELLCFGWIDGIVRRVDDESYSHRMTPRKPVSTWSLVNVEHVKRLTKAGKMHPAGLRAFAVRKKHKIGLYSYEQQDAQPKPQNFPAALGKTFRAAKTAWTFWQTQPPGYQRNLIHWVCSAKQAETSERRLKKLIAASAAGRRLD